MFQSLQPVSIVGLMLLCYCVRFHVTTIALRLELFRQFVFVAVEIDGVLFH